ALDNPGKIGTFALLPLPHVDQCLKEIEHAAGPLKADGFKAQTSYGNRCLGDPTFEPVWDELNRRSAAVVVHPVAPEPRLNMVPGLPVALMESPFDTSRAIASLLYGGVLKRYHQIKFIFAHGGGTVPFLAGRVGAPARTTRKDVAPDGFQAALG